VVDVDDDVVPRPLDEEEEEETTVPFELVLSTEYVIVRAVPAARARSQTLFARMASHD
jgi:hypothetical protein